MGQRKRTRDRRKSNAPAALKTVRGEGPKQRHARRLEFGWENESRVRKWCRNNGNIALRITNGGHHWSFRLPDGGRQFAQWWPSTAKLVFDKQWGDGIHVHDYQQLTSELHKYLKARPDSNGKPALAKIEQPPEGWLTWNVGRLYRWLKSREQGTDKSD